MEFRIDKYNEYGFILISMRNCEWSNVDFPLLSNSIFILFLHALCMDKIDTIINKISERK